MGAIRTIGIALSFVALCMTVYCLATPHWAISVQNNNGIQTGVQKSLGLWKYCEKAVNADNGHCQKLSQFGIAALAQYGIIGFRVLVIIGLICAIIGFVAGTASSDAINIAPTKIAKVQAAGGAAGLLSIAGIMILAATSWAAHMIIKRWKDFQMHQGSISINAGTQWTLGAAIYVGWCASAIFIGVAIIMFMGCCSGSGDEEDEEREQFHPGYATSNYSAPSQKSPDYV
ncbi:Oidioi.mRNA.OKI2018_I69.PAR.g9135.t1.cds [Oikopleura dioica]|uniref:Oidioi.mRNA.OKI2018_I69.PAR.g9135.t1.cds n=1 Tax=Oikopleura dioica TaxID=34765 RepID=A0ABN7RK67_OIKDI|nr:Oidioi.mRNA.OKI2018_I69.PAR.g9135.t1.cds [Oikopleura dioica]